jgi:hypothetical protein
LCHLRGDRDAASHHRIHRHRSPDGLPGRFGEQLVAGYLDKVSLSFLVDDLRVTARENRAFLGHAVRFLVRDAGIGADP